MADGGSQQRKPDFRAAVEDVKALATVLAMEAEAVLGRRTARFLGVLVLFAVVVGVLLTLLNWYIAPSSADQKKDVVATLAQILGGAALLSGLYFTWRTLQVNREGQITERFTRAIDQLGATDDKGERLFEIRIGGIYALERIAAESGEDYWPIMEVLTAYVRQHAPWPPLGKGQQDEEDAAAEDPGEDSGASRQEESKPFKLPRRPVLAPDIHAIMTVLRRRARSLGHGEPEALDLHETNLSGADLYAANLVAANLSAAYLWGADLFRANLSGADLHEANLRGANLSGADLREARLFIANLSATLLRGADLRGATFWKANLLRADLSEADLRRVNLSEANLSEANLSRADLSGADLYEANLSGAYLSSREKPLEADLGVLGVLSRAVQRADLRGADLRGANLSGADLSEANLSEEQVQATNGDENTRLPPGRKPPAHWGVKTDEQAEED